MRSALWFAWAVVLGLVGCGSDGSDSCADDGTCQDESPSTSDDGGDGDGDGDGNGDGDGDGDGDQTDPGGPRFLSFGTNVSSITNGERVIFSAVLTAGDDELVGGTLLSADGSIQYGPFVTGSSKGAYSLELSWSEISQAQDITFVDDEERTFVAQFFDTGGRKATKSVAIGLTCGGDSACSGKCVDLASDLYNCGSCGRGCPDSGAQQGYCTGGACIIHELEPTACDSLCEQHGFTCSATCQFRDGAPEHQAVETWYSDFEAVPGTSCDTVPPDMNGDYEFESQSCCCR